MGATVKMIRLDYLQSSPWILTIEFGMRQSQLFVDLTYPLCITVPFFTVICDFCCKTYNNRLIYFIRFSLTGLCL